MTESICLSDGCESRAFSFRIPRAIQLLQKFGYQLLSPPEFYAQRELETGIHCLERVLSEQIAVFNRFESADSVAGIPHSSAIEAVKQIRSQIQGEHRENREWLHHLLSVGFEVRSSTSGDGHRRLRLVDWDCATENCFHLAVVTGPDGEGTDGSESRLLCFLNGLPVATINFVREPGFVGDSACILPCVVPYDVPTSLLRVRLSDRGELLTGAGASMGSFCCWDNFEQGESCGEFIRRWPDARDHARLLTYLDPGDHAAFERYSLQRRGVLRDERCLWNLLRPERLLELIDCYTEYRQEELVVASHQEFLAVQAVVDHVGHSIGNGVQWVARRSVTNHYFAFLVRALLGGAVPDLVHLTVVSADETLRGRLSHWLCRAQRQAEGGRSSNRLGGGSGSVEILSPGDFLAIHELDLNCRKDAGRSLVLIEQTSCEGLLDHSALQQVKGSNEAIVVLLEHPPSEGQHVLGETSGWESIPGVSWQDTRAGGALPLYWMIPAREHSGEGHGIAPKDQKRLREAGQLERRAFTLVVWDILRHFASWCFLPGSEGWILAGSKETALEIWRGLLALDGVVLVDSVNTVFAQCTSLVVEFEGHGSRLVLRSELGQPLRVKTVDQGAPGLPDLVILDEAVKLPPRRKDLSVFYLLGDLGPSVLGSLYGRLVANGEGKDWGMIVDFRWTRPRNFREGKTGTSRRHGVIDDLFGAVDILGEVLPSLRRTLTSLEELFSPLQWSDDRCEFEMSLRDEEKRRLFVGLLEEYVKWLTLAYSGGLLPSDGFNERSRPHRTVTLFLAELLGVIRIRFGTGQFAWGRHDDRIARLTRFYGERDVPEKPWRSFDVLDPQRRAQGLGMLGSARARGDAVLNNLRWVLETGLRDKRFLRRQLLDRVSELEIGVEDSSLTAEDYFWSAELLLEEARVELDLQLSNEEAEVELPDGLGAIVGECLGSVRGMQSPVSGFQLGEAKEDYFKSGQERGGGFERSILKLKRELGRIVLKHRVTSGSLNERVKDRIRNEVDDVLFAWCRGASMNLDDARLDQLSERLLAELFEQ